jgi:23S rRNA (cytidine1920-2'-O)/16S rRNA (cytidine1409-2'-O)-methyltransferase
MKVRLDKLMLQRALVSSRERAQALILAGRVLVNEQKVEKAGANVENDAPIRVLGDAMPFVSRGGLKLARALDHWGIDARGKNCLDVGASTGGFTDCLLQQGASHVIAVDTGYGQMDLKIRNDPRVRLLEKTNARYLSPVQLWPDGPTANPVELIVMDVSFISATLVLPAVLQTVRACALQDFELIVLVKPQFEVGREQVGKGGIVRDPQAQEASTAKVAGAVEQLGGTEIEVIDSPLLGAEGNREFLLHARFAGTAAGKSLGAPEQTTT